ncbi:MAG: hypothetical protein KKB70_01960 [Proteobacteria bacterium]|nr:hypothetical protein [Pseudomonadota bacterium]
MLSNRDLKDLGYFLISPEDSRSEEYRRMLTNRPVRGLPERYRKTVVRISHGRAAGVCKTLVWVVVSVVMGCGLGQLH